LDPWPVQWSQLRDRAFDADGDQNANNNCGPACLSAVLNHLYGFDVPNDVLVEMIANDHKGNTTIGQLAALLRSVFGIACEVYGPGRAVDPLRPTVESAINRGFPIVVLFAGNGAALKVAHFMTVIGYDAAGCVVHDPWDGVERRLSWPVFEDLQLFAQAFVIKRRRETVKLEPDYRAVAFLVEGAVRLAESQGKMLEAAFLREVYLADALALARGGNG
jgi:ABC-type bacteriocin/lantibiotic exporter with double-glycine peptidase domain